MHMLVKQIRILLRMQSLSHRCRCIMLTSSPHIFPRPEPPKPHREVRAEVAESFGAEGVTAECMPGVIPCLCVVRFQTSVVVRVEAGICCHQPGATVTVVIIRLDPSIQTLTDKMMHTVEMLIAVHSLLPREMLYIKFAHPLTFTSLKTRFSSLRIAILFHTYILVGVIRGDEVLHFDKVSSFDQID